MKMNINHKKKKMISQTRFKLFLSLAIVIIFFAANSCEVADVEVKKDPIITWSNPADITVGTPLDSTQLNATSDAIGTFAYVPPIGTILSVGANQDLKVAFIPTDGSNYNTISKTVKINVISKDPVITWANPANIAVGTSLSATQLNATADVAGAFIYTPPIGTILSVGDNQTLTVDFTPTDLINYNKATKTVKINVFDINIPIMVNIPAGTFMMGSPTTEVNRLSNEELHQVTLSSFKMSKYEITNAEYAVFLNSIGIGSSGEYPGRGILLYPDSSRGLIFIGSQWVPVAGYANHPATLVTWHGANEFANFVGGKLPSEAQWEYACRGNTTTPFNTGECLSNAQANYAWEYPYSTCSNTITTSHGTTQAAGTYPANAFGLHDMHGNVNEWCSDWYGNYPTTAQTNPTGPTTGWARVIRGGSWDFDAEYCRSASRSCTNPDFDRIRYPIGFRVVLVP